MRLEFLNLKNCAELTDNGIGLLRPSFFSALKNVNLANCPHVSDALIASLQGIVVEGRRSGEELSFVVNFETRRGRHKFP